MKISDARLWKALTTNWSSGFHWLVWSLIGMIGLWGFAVVVVAYYHPTSWLTPFDHGELFVYGAGFVAPCMYTIQKERKVTQFPFRAFLSCVCTIMLVVGIVFFAASAVTGLSNTPELIPKPLVMRYVGLGFLGSCMVLGFLIVILEELRADINVHALNTLGEEKLNSDWDKMQGR